MNEDADIPSLKEADAILSNSSGRGVGPAVTE
jgi:hypothetical protein